MKTKHPNKKLSLSKQTVADLSSDELKSAKGGTIVTMFTCTCTLGAICFSIGQSCFEYLCIQQAD